MMMYTSIFNLNTPLKWPEYVRTKLSDIPDEVIDKYEPREKANKHDNVYAEVIKGMYGLL